MLPQIGGSPEQAPFLLLSAPKWRHRLIADTRRARRRRPHSAHAGGQSLQYGENRQLPLHGILVAIQPGSLDGEANRCASDEPDELC